MLDQLERRIHYSVYLDNTALFDQWKPGFGGI